MLEHITDRNTFVIFGATGDLTRRKLLPALYRLATKTRFGGNSLVLGVGRKTGWDDREFRKYVCDALPKEDGVAQWADASVFYQHIGEGEPSDYAALAAGIQELEGARGLPDNRIFYLALPPAAFASAVKRLGQCGLNRSSGWTRIVIEKPFGMDLESAQELNRILHRYFDEGQVYRIDHYLGKETVQNLQVFRFANPIFESVWNRDRVAGVDILVAEDAGVEGRAGYYDAAGALRDMVQNHLAQLLALVAMEPPSDFSPELVRNEKLKVLRSIRPVSASDAVFGQYEGYREEPGVRAGSNTETFVAVQLRIANWRWQGVPFYLRAGKKLKRRLTQVVVMFRCPPVDIFRPYSANCELHSNALVITIQPDEGFDLKFEVKTPGQPMDIQSHSLRFRYAEEFRPLADAYETLLLDVMNGDQTLFIRDDFVEASWQLFGPLLETPVPAYPYPPGSWGPAEADQYQSFPLEL